MLAKLTLRTKRQTATSSSSASTRSASSPLTTPDTETPTTSFSGQADYGLGYSSINHERSPTYTAKRTSRALATRPIEFDRCAEPSSSQQKDYALHTRSLPRSNKLSVVHDGGDPLFVQIIHEAAPTSPIQSTVRAQSRSIATSPLDCVINEFARPQSPLALKCTVSRSSSSCNPPRRPSPRRCHSSFNPSPFADESKAHPSTPSLVAGKKGVYMTKEDAERQTRNVILTRPLYLRLIGFACD